MPNKSMPASTSSTPRQRADGAEAKAATMTPNAASSTVAQALLV